MTAGLAKEADDTLQLRIEAGSRPRPTLRLRERTKLRPAGVSGIFRESRQGRDLVLPRFTDMDPRFDWPLAATPALPGTTSRTRDRRITLRRSISI
jgi:hypothetical protein